jgi:hypothetical protein
VAIQGHAFAMISQSVPEYLLHQDSKPVAVGGLLVNPAQSARRHAEQLMGAA